MEDKTAGLQTLGETNFKISYSSPFSTSILQIIKNKLDEKKKACN